MPPEGAAPDHMDENDIQEEPFVFRPLNESDLTDLLFPDHLVAYTKSDVRAGEFQVSFKIVRLAAQTAVRAEMSADGSLAGVPSGTRVSALLDMSLLTLHEECAEYLELPGGPVLERRWTLQRDSDSNGAMRWARHSRRRPPPFAAAASEPWRSEAGLEVAAAESVIGEASAFLLQRLLVLRPALLGIAEAPLQLPQGRRWRVLTVDRDGALRPASFVWLGAAEAAEAEAVGVLRQLGERRIASWFDAGGCLLRRKIEHWPVELRADKGRGGERGDEIAERRPSVTPSGCFCGFISGGPRQRSARSQRQ